MTIEDVADKADVWSEAIKKIIKAISAAGIALATCIAALLAWWPSGDAEDPEPAVLTGTGYSPQCSQLYNTIDHTWTESQWTFWEQLRRDLGC
jgi:hypothetical protein|tara:strand:+ start:74 stop:352 length:279 start_codon:yes stop_codon:yes gene_type:complete